MRTIWFLMHIAVTSKALCESGQELYNEANNNIHTSYKEALLSLRS